MNHWLYKRSARYVSAALGCALAVPAAAEAADSSGPHVEEIIVTARRKDESLQDVPTTINAVTGDDLQRLNLRKFEDIAAVVPGLTMSSNANGVGASASVRGVAYDVGASGNNGTVEFYLNDAPISAGNLFQTMYDVQQVELLRGPQGTLRGRAAPSGSMTVTTRRPDLYEVGGYVSATGTDIGGYNGQGAVNIPLVADKLAIRVAGAYEKNEVNRVTSINTPEDPSLESRSGRATLLFEPTESLAFTLTYQKTAQDIVSFDQHESLQVINPSAAVNPGAPGGPTSPRFITAGDRLSVLDTPRDISQDFENINLQVQWSFGGQRLNYVGARNDQRFQFLEPYDYGDFFPSSYPAFLKGFGQVSGSHPTADAHELRLSSEERIAGRFDYIAGVFYQELDSPTDLTRPTPLLSGAPSPTVGGRILQTSVARRGGNEEKSGFANLTAHLGAATELSAGARYIEYHSEGSLFVNGVRNRASDEDRDFTATIYSASLKHSFSDDLMVYASTGTSWRPGPSVIGDNSLQRSALENAFLILPPEESTSYEVGFKASALDNRLRAAVSAYHQKFDNYPYRSASGVFFVETTGLGPPPVQRVNRFNFVGPVPVEVNGVEADITFAPTSAWVVAAAGSYALGKIKNGLIPCNDYSPRDGVPDSSSTIPNVTDIQTATGGGTISACTVDYRSSLAPLWSASLQSEYNVPVTATINGYVRGLLSAFGDSQNDPTNAVDDYNGYELLNIYLGVRAADGTWEVSLYGKNVTDTERVLVRSSVPQTTNYNIGATSQTGVSNYYGGSATTGLGMTPPREFGLAVRYAFGSR